jgi:hypothetical protein
LTVSDIGKVWLKAPLVPCTEKLKLPVLALPDAVTVSVLLVLPPDGGVAGLGLNEQLDPDGMPLHERLTALLKPFVDVMVQVLVVFDPWATVRPDGLQEIEKSGVVEAAGVTCSQLLTDP